ncbi:DUF4214 domain-containing protein [Mameliella alba]|uniref:DUF4214 domain-containing protein n=1 Tax=Mameliella alba TaxID=561184 RepID=UPI000B533190|nr:DUF4214 domain-containing protein [Mameliella alba]MBY6122611.1 DUF4214 domain-containing protein [Mameliella alba]OWV39268.1 hypothetical protein CDZ95_27100 [Mameliella alba]
MVTITDPRYAQQWHFDLIGDIETVWQEVSGAGIHVAIYDDGMDQGHVDLAANYDASLHYAGLGSDDGRHNSGADGHGTSVAGLVGAARNGVGVIGLAWGARLTSVDYLNDIQTRSDAVIEDALAWGRVFDVVNQSYGVTPEFSDDWDVGDPGSYAWQEARGMARAVTEGRGGLGTVFVKAAGNEANDPVLAGYGILGNAQGEGHNVLHTVIVVGAVGRDGRVMDYSNFGANLLISGPAASLTTDVTGSAGYDPGAWTSSFGGTSAATPVVAGVVALMLETEPGLGYRDVQEILAQSASQTGSAYGGPAEGWEAGEWRAYGGSWNGGGLSFSPSYGFGLVDAFAAVRMAEHWLEMRGGVAATETSLVRASFSQEQSRPIFDFADARLSITVDEGMVIEHVYVTVEITHSYASDLTLVLVAPDGSEVVLADGDGGSSALSGDWTFGVAALRGLSSEGTWTVRVSDGSGGNLGTLKGIALEFLGRPEGADDIWTFTDDFPALLAADPDRAQAHDGNGGSDWINAAALADPVTIALGETATLAVAGRPWAGITGGIENAVSGDGDDVLTGGAGANVLRAGRGRDLVTGAGGADDLSGGPGGDVLQGGGAGLYHTEISAQVYRLYLAVFGRQPDVGGHQVWVQRLTLGQMGLDGVAGAFIAAPEFAATYGETTDEAFLTLLYANVLHRAPDASGLASWLAALEGGMTRARVVLLFAESPEHQAATATAQAAYDRARDVTSWADDVFRLYHAIFDRDPDPGGFEGWTGALAAGTRSFEQVVSGFMGAPEFTATYGAATDDTAFVTLLYENVLKRMPDPEGLAGWVARLEDGMSRVKLVMFFLASPEFVATTTPALAAWMAARGEDDVLRADGGADLLSGGLYADRFVFAADGADGPVTVTDLEPWDVLVFEGFGMAAEQLLAAMTQQGDDVVLEAAGETLVFLDTDLAQIDAGMIELA